MKLTVHQASRRDGTRCYGKTSKSFVDIYRPLLTNNASNGIMKEVVLMKNVSTEAGISETGACVRVSVAEQAVAPLCCRTAETDPGDCLPRVYELHDDDELLRKECESR